MHCSAGLLACVFVQYNCILHLSLTVAKMHFRGCISHMYFAIRALIYFPLQRDIYIRLVCELLLTQFLIFISKV